MARNDLNKVSLKKEKTLVQHDTMKLEILALRDAVNIAADKGFKVSWIDSTVIAERPRLAGYIDSMNAGTASTGLDIGHDLLAGRSV